MKKASLCSGIGGVDLAAKWAGMDTVVFCEREPFPQSVLRKHWPGIPIIDDIYNFTKKEVEALGIGRIDLVSAGYPCQPFSTAGKRRGKEDDRHLWPEVKRVLHELRPPWFVGENVAGHISMGLDDVLSDLEAEDYETAVFVLPASAVNARHQRNRISIIGLDREYVGNSKRLGCGRESRRRAGQEPSDGYVGNEERTLADAASSGLPECGQPGIPANQKKTGAGANAGPERRGEELADPPGGGFGEEGNNFGRSAQRSSRSSFNVADAEGVHTRGLSVGAEEENAGPSFTCEDVAYPGGAGREELHASPESDRSGFYSWRDHAGGAIRPIKPGMGGSADEFSAWLDGRGLNPLDALSDFIINYPQPAPRGMPQYGWEPPRVISGLKDRAARLHAIGNAVDPLQFFPIMMAIKIIDDWIRRGNSCGPSTH